jgi:hypothetical protein
MGTSRRLCRRFGWLSLPVLLAACREPGVSVNVPGEAVAVGALLPLSVSDDCKGGGKLNFCSTDSLVSVDSFKVDDERVATLLRMEELNEGLRTGDALVIAAKAPGSTALTIKATFDDGLVRSFDGNVSVKRAERIYVALNTEQTSAFMNAISEKYHTSCPACMVDNPVTSCEGDGRTYCKSGTCSMLRP